MPDAERLVDDFPATSPMKWASEDRCVSLKGCGEFGYADLRYNAKQMNPPVENLPPKKRRISRFITIGIPLLLCTAVIFIYSAFSVYRSARNLSTAAYLHSIVTGLNLYAKNNGSYPPVGVDWQKLLVNSELAPVVHFVSPRSRVNRTSWLYIPPAENLGEIKNPETVILLFEDPASTDEDPLFVAVADGNVVTMTRNELRRKVEGAKLSDGSVFNLLRDPK